MGDAPMHNSMLRYTNDNPCFSHRVPFVPKLPISPDAFFAVSLECFHQLCTENPRTFVEKTVFGIRLEVDRRLSGTNFVLHGGAK